MATQSQSRVVIIGGGIIGMAAAAELATRGVSVTVLEQGEIGHGCSYGNAGWVTPCFAMPLPMPGMLMRAIGWLKDPESPLYIQPSFDSLLFRWIFRFLRSMNRPQALRAIEVLTGISKYSLEAYRDLSQNSSLPVRFEQKGLLMVSRESWGVEVAQEEMEYVRPHGIPGKFLSASEALALEPMLKEGVLGGVYFPTEAHVEPLQAVLAFRERAEKAGAKVLSGVEVFSLETEGDAVRSLWTSKGTIPVDQVILATGSWTEAMARTLGINIPILGGKGYAVIADQLPQLPRTPIMCVERKVAITPRENTLRIAGTMEIVNQDFSLTQRRVKAMLRGAHEFLKLPEKLEIKEVWRGLRPCTSDGVPAVGRSPFHRNLWISAGHQMLGLQSSPGSAKLLADLFLGVTPQWNPEPFDPKRFN